MNALFVLRPAKLWAFNIGHPCPSPAKGSWLAARLACFKYYYYSWHTQRPNLANPICRQDWGIAAPIISTSANTAKSALSKIQIRAWSKDASQRSHKVAMHGRIKTATQSRCTMQRHKWLSMQGRSDHKRPQVGATTIIHYSLFIIHHSLFIIH